MEFNYNDGGRQAEGYKGIASDCVTRAIAIVTKKPYQEVYNALHEGIKEASKGKGKVAKSINKRGNSPRNGVHRKVYDKYMKSIGWEWQPTMQIGQGCTVHLKSDELPKGRIVVRVSKHVVAVIDGVLNDTHDCSRGGSRCVYGYYYKSE